MFDAATRQGLETNLLNQFSKPQKASLHIRG